MNIDYFSKRVKELRTSRKLSQKSFGEAIGLSMQAINDIEHSRSNTTLERAMIIADFFDVTLDYLVGRSDQKKIVSSNADFSSKEEELIKNFKLLNDVSKGKLIERSRMLLEESPSKSLDNKKNA